MLKNKNKTAAKTGFSLVEVLIAMSILTMGISAISFLMLSNIKSSQEAKNQVIAMGLAQEGIELVRNFKDNGNALPATTGDYIVDYNSTDSTFNSSQATSANEKLYLDSSGFYVNSVKPTTTKFSRKVNVQSSNNQVTSFVSWNASGMPAACTVANKCVSIVSVMP